MHEQRAFVLHTRPFKENQQLVELLTEDQGKVSALVYVGQSKRSIKKALLQPFLPITLALKGQGTSLKRITTIDATAKSFPLSKDHLYSAFYINELLVKLLNDEIACEYLFSHYQAALLALSQGLEIAQQLRQFELVLLDELGLSFDFSPVFAEQPKHVVGFYFLPEQGFMPAYQYSVNKITTPWFSIEHIQSIAEHVLDGKVLVHQGAKHTFKLLMRDVFNHLLDGKVLNSRQLFTKNKR